MEDLAVFVVDTNIAVQTLAKLALRGLPLAVDRVPGNRLVELAAKKRPRLVICSKDQAGIDALETCRKIREQDEGLIFLLLIAGSERRSLIPEIKEAGVSEILMKPFTSEQLSQAVKRLLWPEEFSETETVFLALKEQLLARAMEKLLHSWNLAVRSVSSVAELQLGEEKQRAVLTITDDTSSPGYQWYSPQLMGNLVVLAKQKVRIPKPLQQNMVVVERPVRTEAIEEILRALFGRRGRKEIKAEERPFFRAGEN
jgi:CheY-like chemotaxis protein